ncbi:nickel-dependent hydrogenase large subunit [Helicobacter mustelae]|uniref:Ni/Fe-hydrogenase large subunit n=1 Tax=Helicobacter mustelae (strain ATCC 43772 / CCUG 25715 / CIP 103759 / LMG 18044 / NCTC 12198 / R85-136P) TaxID=679897 RepID=D3UIC4_HELM1|nr:nickel-dependent hydrogenase large subunit [Helicobacter mustelae]CBG40247.1 Ni/Fe-hydrogenase large subunit [Helicobacter mustelae 12198]SQH71746.1 Ni/Fe-hydrogenase large subunit [Helicobacter mustelae]
MTKRIVVDPITRIEGHLRIEVIVDENNVITDAFSSSTLFRGLETIIKGRDPRDAGFIAQRICGVCTFSHYKAGVMAVEDALGIKPPLNAQMVRSLMNISLMLHDHVVHFYTLHGLDWCDITSALKADPAKASKEAFKYTDLPTNTGEDELKRVQKRVGDFVKQGALGPFNNGYWGHKTYHFTPEQNLIVLSHYLKLLEIQRELAKMMAIFGAKQPHPQSLTVGGVTSVMDILDPTRLGEWKAKFDMVCDFVHHAYYADLVMAGRAFNKEQSVLKGCNLKNFISHAEMQIGPNEFLFTTGVVLDGDLSRVHPIDENLIKEEVTNSWYKYENTNEVALHPYVGQTNPNYTGFKDGKSLGPEGKMVDSKLLDMKGKYSWIKSPRYNELPMEVGPLASVVVGLAGKNPYITPVATQFLKDTGLPIEALFSTLGRTAARCIEAVVICNHGAKAFETLVENLKSDHSTCAPYIIDKNKEYQGRYIGNVPRGMLSHWVRIKNGIVENYQAVVPSTWNAGPRDHKGLQGAFETSLIGTKIVDLTKPLEIIRTIHSFDPCIACSVHMMDTKGNALGEYKVEPNFAKI